MRDLGRKPYKLEQALADLAALRAEYEQAVKALAKAERSVSRSAYAEHVAARAEARAVLSSPSAREILERT